MSDQPLFAPSHLRVSPPGVSLSNPLSFPFASSRLRVSLLTRLARRQPPTSPVSRAGHRALAQLARLASLALLCALLPAPCSASAPSSIKTIDLSEIRSGQTGTVWTVFQGTEPEPFEVEVAGVLQNALGPGRSLIVCKLTDSRVQKMGAVAGMSGSPLYIDGRYAGALSYQLQKFETVRHAGFTPVADLLSVADNPLANAPRQLPPAGREVGPQPLAPPLAIAGLSPDVAQFFGPAFADLGLQVAPLGGSSNGRSKIDAHLRPGSPVGVALALGDVTIAATGTVSWVDGDRLIAFGHPMLGLGEVALPLASAEIVTILPSLQSSFKIANTGDLIGTLTQDRLSGIAGKLGPIPRMVPVTIRTPERELNFKVVRHDRLTPVICAASLMQAVKGSNAHGQIEALKVVTTIRYEGAPDLVLDNWYQGQDGLANASASLVSRLSLPLQGPFHGLIPESISMTVERITADPELTLDTVQPSTTQPLPGETVSLALAARGPAGAAPSATLQIPVPAEWAGRKLDLIVTSGPNLDRLTGRPEGLPASQLRDIDSFVSWQNDSRREDGLYVAVVERADAMLDEVDLWHQAPGSLERIARRADESRFAKREVMVPLWSQHVFANHLVDGLVRRPLVVAD